LKLLIYIVFLIIIINTTLASETTKEVIKYNPDFLHQLTTAESDGIGESTAAYSRGVQSLGNNPAGLSYTENVSFALIIHKFPSIEAVIMKELENGKWIDYSKYNIDNTEMGGINCALPMGRLGNLGISFILHYNGNFIRVNENGKAVNSFPEGDMAFGISYSHRIFENASIGIDIKSVRSKIVVDDKINIGHTYTLNAGFMHQIVPRVRVGAVFQNAGNDFSFKNPEAGISSELPRKLLIGAVYILRDKGNSLITCSMDINPPFDSEPKYSMGLELLYINHIFLRIGYMSHTHEYHSKLINLQDGISTYEDRTWTRKGITFGAGARIGKMEINIGFTPIRKPVLNNGEKIRLEGQKNIMSLSCIARI